MLTALAIDTALGWPTPIFQRIGHPVTWIGQLISWLDHHINRGTPTQRRLAGITTDLLVIGVAAAPALAAQALLPKTWIGLFITGIFAWPLVAARSLHDHVAAVAAPLTRGDLQTARTAVSMIVGRDPTKLDAPGIARAALESLAENASDGVIAPLFWGAIFGLPGIAAYKAINTLDSMIGHRTPRYEAFGWASARIDDLANLIPARLTALNFACVSKRPRAALVCMLKDARRHRSPNAGWPEAAMAGALAIRLSGPRIYQDRIANEPWLNPAAPDPDAKTMHTGLSLYHRAIAAAALLLALAMW